MTNSAVIFIAKNNFKSSPHPQEEILNSGWHTEPPHRNSLIPRTVPSTNSSKSENVILCLIPIWPAPYGSHWLKWWLHPPSSTFKPGVYFSPPVSPAVIAGVELALADQQRWSGDAFSNTKEKHSCCSLFMSHLHSFDLHSNTKMNKPHGKSTDPALSEEDLRAHQPGTLRLLQTLGTDLNIQKT